MDEDGGNDACKNLGGCNVGGDGDYGDSVFDDEGYVDGGGPGDYDRDRR